MITSHTFPFIADHFLWVHRELDEGMVRQGDGFASPQNYCMGGLCDGQSIIKIAEFNTAHEYREYGWLRTPCLSLKIQFIIGVFWVMEYDDYQKQISQVLLVYEQAEGPAQNIYKKVKNQMDLYEIYLEDNMGAGVRKEWLKEKQEKLKTLQVDKTAIKNQDKIKEIMNLGNDIHGRLNDIHANTAKAIDVATYIRLDLDKQIEALDSLEDENKEFAKRMKRAKKGLQVIIRRAMMNKCTQCLMVLMILAVIALIIVYAVKSQDNPQPQP